MSSVEWYKRKLRDKHGVKEEELEKQKAKEAELVKEREAKETRERMAKEVQSSSSVLCPTLKVGGHSDSITDLAISPDGKRLASCSSGDARIGLWTVSSLGYKGYKPRLLEGHSCVAGSVAFSHDSTILASGSGNLVDPGDKRIGVWDLSRSNNPYFLKTHSPSVMSVAFSPDGKYLASGSHKGQTLLWDASLLAEKGYTPISLKVRSSTVTSVAFSPDSKRLAVGFSILDPRDTILCLWDIPRLAEKEYEPVSIKDWSLFAKYHSCNSLAFSQDGKYLACHFPTGSGTYLWDVSSMGKAEHEPRFLSNRGGGRNSFAFSPDGKYLASADQGPGYRVDLFEVSRLGEKGYDGLPVYDVNVACPIVFSPDSKRLFGCVEVRGWRDDSDPSSSYGICVMEVKP